MIEFQDISKSYRRTRRGAGFGSAVKSLFRAEYDTVRAIDHISFFHSEGRDGGIYRAERSGEKHYD